MSRLYFVWTLAAVFIGALFEQASAGCTPSFPSDPTCPSKCGTCQPVIRDATCWTGCQGNCNDADLEVDSDWGCGCGWFCISSEKKCLYTKTGYNDQCASCASGRYGTNCNECPNGAANPCNINTANGQCNDGLSGNGQCTCLEGYAGTSCQHSSSVTCNSRGDVDNNGNCNCDIGHAGSNCQLCDTAAGYTRDPSLPATAECVLCIPKGPTSTCSDHAASCTVTGECVCEDAYRGAICDECSVGYYEYDICRKCDAATDCGGRGVCDSNGYCECEIGLGGPGCSECAAGYYGPNCDPCPGSPDVCSAQYNLFLGLSPNTCADSKAGNGECTCVAPFQGVDCADPVLLGVTPLTGSNQGFTITLQGYHFAGGSVKAGGQTLVATVSTDTFIQAEVPSGFGDPRAITVQVGGRESIQSWAITYDPPVILRTEPASVGTEGGLVDVIGSGFVVQGTPASFTLGATQLTVTTAQCSPTSCRVLIPPGQGTANLVATLTPAMGAPDVSAPSPFSYESPFVTGVTTQGLPTEGAVSVTVEGGNFGTTPQVTIGGAPCAYGAHTTTQIQCTLPAGRGFDQTVVVTVAGLQGTGFYSYGGPQISSVQGCPVDLSYGATSGCQTSGGDVIIVQGANFGASVNCCGNTLQVRVGGNLCTSLSMPTPHSTLQCSLPAGSGVNRTIQVSIDAARVEEDFVSYATPRIDPTLLRFAGQAADINGGISSIQLASLSGTPSVTFGGQYFGSTLGDTVVTYGSFEDPTAFACATTNVADAEITCTVEAGVGGPLHFQVELRGDTLSNVGLDELFYPGPTITNDTLKLTNDPTSNPGGSQLGKSSEGELVEFEGSNFGTRPEFVRVTYGPVGQLDLYTCEVQNGFFTSNKIVCKTSPGSGADLRFRVAVGPGTAKLSADSNFEFSYPTAPIVSSVSLANAQDGCVPGTNNNLVSCPTDALDSNRDPIRIAITGQYFGSTAAVVRVAGYLCANLVHDSTTPNELVTCDLPAGSGVNQAVVLNQLELFSTAAELITYATPTLVSLTGCTDVFPNTEGCQRTGGDVLLLTGTNFGFSDAKVIVGFSAAGVVHVPGQEHTALQVTLPEGTDEAVPLLMIQFRGPSSQEQITVGYAQCPAGQYAEGNDILCQDCPPSTYTDVPSSTSCIDCEAGRFSATNGSAICDPCPAGEFNDVRGRASCQLCEAGRAMEGTGAVACTVCAGGTFATEGSRVCSPCPKGQVQSAVGQSSCELCTPGRAIDSTGAIDCDPCPAGSATAVNGSRTCPLCREGSYSKAGAETCTLCEEGRFSAASGQKDACDLCPSGRYSDRLGAAECFLCQPGYAASEAGAFQCSACDVGETSDLGARVCQKCSPGRFNDVQGAFRCTACPRGTYQSNAGSSECTNCTAGRFMGSTGQPGCVECAPGFYSPGVGATQCLSCPAGRFSANGAGRGSLSCTDCPTGKFAPNVAAFECIPCGAGTYADNTGLSSCLACRPGRYSAAGQAICSNCTAGSFADQLRSVNCELCQAGTYSAEGADSCIDCLPGTAVDREGADVCPPCALGKSAGFPGQIVCDECIGGRYSDELGLQQCKKCQAGTFSEQVQRQGPTGCTPCSEGKYTPDEDYDVCLNCTLGTASDQEGTTQCPGCLPGTYQDEYGQTDCKPCAEGRFTEVAGESLCLPCLAGTYTDSNGTAICTECEEGRVQPGLGSNTCNDCAPGKAMPSTGQVVCVNCKEGTYTNSTGVSECQPCEEGRYQIGRGKNECDECEVGRYQSTTGNSLCLPCKVGRYSNLTGVADCFACPEGRYQDQLGQLSCVDCPVGRFAQEPGSVACTQCPAGTYASQQAQQTCDDCEAGRYQPLLGTDTCELTPRGTYSVGGASLPTPCNIVPNTVAPFRGMTACVNCDRNAKANEETTECECGAGSYSFSPKGQQNTSTIKCFQCPECADCRLPGVIWEEIDILPGCWRKGNSTLFYPCLLPDHCVGGQAATCNGNRDPASELCSECLPGYRSTTPLGACTKCPDSPGQSYGVSIVIIVGIVCVLLFMYYLVLKSDKSLQREQIRINDLRSSKSRLAVEASSSMSANARSLELDAELASQPMALSAVQDRARPNVTYKLKIMIGFFQIATNLSFIVDAPWPSAYQSFISTFNVVNLDFVPWQSVGCVSGINYFDRVTVMIVTPLALLAVLAVGFLLPMYIKDKHDMQDSEKRRMNRKLIRQQFWKLVLFTVFLVYPIVSATILRVFVCREVEGVSFLPAAAGNGDQIICGSPRYNAYLPLAIAGLIIYPIGVPAVMFYILWRNQRNLGEPGVRIQLGFLYEAYAVDIWWFEMLDMLHKLTMTGLVGFLPSDWQLPGAMGIVVSYLLVILLARPYLRKGDDRLHQLVQVELLLVLMAATVMNGLGTGYDPTLDVLMSIVLIGMICGLFALFLVMGVRNVRKSLRDKQRGYRKRKHMNFLDSEEESGSQSEGQGDMSSSGGSGTHSSSEEGAGGYRGRGSGSASEEQQFETGQAEASESGQDDKDSESSDGVCYD